MNTNLLKRPEELDIYHKLCIMNDEDVVYFAQIGCKQAADIILERYRNLIESKTRSFFLIGADKDDVIQEGMLGFCKAVRDFCKERTAYFGPFADMCITRQIITAVKTSRRNKHFPLNSSISLEQTLKEENGETTLLDLLPDEASLDKFTQSAKIKNIENLLSSLEKDLTPLEQKVLTHYLDGKSYSEISNKIECNTKSIDNALQRIKKKMLTIFHDSNRSPSLDDNFSLN